MSSSVTSWTAARQASLYFTISWSCSDPGPLSWWCYLTILSSATLFSFCLKSFPASGLFQWVSSSHQVAKALGLCALISISPSNEYSGLISFRIDRFVIQETLKSLLQHHSSKASILRCSAFFMLQLSHPYVTTGETLALTIQTFVSKVTSLLLNILSRFVTAFSQGASVF